MSCPKWESCPARQIQEACNIGQKPLVDEFYGPGGEYDEEMYDIVATRDQIAAGGLSKYQCEMEKRHLAHQENALQEKIEHLQRITQPRYDLVRVRKACLDGPAIEQEAGGSFRLCDSLTLNEHDRQEARLPAVGTGDPTSDSPS